MAACLFSDSQQLQAAAIALVHTLTDNQKSVVELRRSAGLLRAVEDARARLGGPAEEQEAVAEEAAMLEEIQGTLGPATSS